MKKGISILFLFLTLFQLCSRLWIYVSFRIAQDRIAATLCINRDVPDSSCQGHCYLSKQIKQLEEKEQQQVPKSSFKEQIEVLFFAGFPRFDWKMPVLPLLSRVLNAGYLAPHSTSFASGVFLPPER